MNHCHQAIMMAKQSYNIIPKFLSHCEEQDFQNSIPHFINRQVSVKTMIGPKRVAVAWAPAGI